MKRTYKVLAAFLCAAFLMPFYNVQALEVSKQYISHNRSHQYLKPIGIVIHDTDAPGGTAQNNRDYFNRVQVYASAHYFVDWNKSIQCIPENEIAWHAGATANHRYLSIEICMPSGHNPLQFISAYNRAVELVADICNRYGWSVEKIHSHHDVTRWWHETDHEDPDAFFKEYCKNMDSFRQDVAKKLGQTKVTYSEPQTTNAQVIGDWFYVRNKYGTIQQGHRVDDYDNITVHDVSYSKQLVEVTYPTPSGTRNGYIKNSNLIHYKNSNAWKNGSTIEYVYDKPDGHIIGSLDPHESATVLEKNGWTNVVYNTNKGQNTKSGWVKYAGR